MASLIEYAEKNKDKLITPEDKLLKQIEEQAATPGTVLTTDPLAGQLSNEAEELAMMQAPEGLGTDIGNVFKRMPGQLVETGRRALGGATGIAGELARGQEFLFALEDPSGGGAKFWERTAQIAEEQSALQGFEADRAAEIREKELPLTTEPGQLLGEVGQSITAMGPALAAGMVTGNPEAALFVMGNQTGLETFQRAKASGMTTENALAQGVATGAAEGIFEALPTSMLFSWFKKGKKGFAKHFKDYLKYVGAEVATEIPTTWTQNAAEIFYSQVESNPEKAAQDVKDYFSFKPVEVDGAVYQFTDDAAHTALVTALQATILGGVGKGVSGATRKVGEKLDERETERKRVAGEDEQYNIASAAAADILKNKVEQEAVEREQAVFSEAEAAAIQKGEQTVEEVLAGQRSANLDDTAEPTLDEVAAEQEVNTIFDQAEEEIDATRDQQVNLEQEVEIEAELDRHETPAAEALKVDPFTFKQAAREVYTQVKSYVEFAAEMVRRFGEAVKRHTVQLWNAYKRSPLSSQVGAVGDVENKPVARRPVAVEPEFQGYQEELPPEAYEEVPPQYQEEQEPERVTTKIRDVDVTQVKNLLAKDGESRIHVALRDGQIVWDEAEAHKAFAQKRWTKPRQLFDTTAAMALPADFFRNFKEFKEYSIEHEKAHMANPYEGEEQETLGQYEDRMNRIALKAIGRGMPTKPKKQIEKKAEEKKTAPEKMEGETLEMFPKKPTQEEAEEAAVIESDIDAAIDKARTDEDVEALFAAQLQKNVQAYMKAGAFGSPEARNQSAFEAYLKENKEEDEPLVPQPSKAGRRSDDLRSPEQKAIDEQKYRLANIRDRAQARKDSKMSEKQYAEHQGKIIRQIFEKLSKVPRLLQTDPGVLPLTAGQLTARDKKGEFVNKPRNIRDQIVQEIMKAARQFYVGDILESIYQEEGTRSVRMLKGTPDVVFEIQELAQKRAEAAEEESTEQREAEAADVAEISPEAEKTLKKIFGRFQKEITAEDMRNVMFFPQADELFDNIVGGQFKANERALATFIKSPHRVLAFLEARLLDQTTSKNIPKAAMNYLIREFGVEFGIESKKGQKITPITITPPVMEAFMDWAREQRESYRKEDREIIDRLKKGLAVRPEGELTQKELAAKQAEEEQDVPAAIEKVRKQGIGDERVSDSVARAREMAAREEKSKIPRRKLTVAEKVALKGNTTVDSMILDAPVKTLPGEQPAKITLKQKQDHRRMLRNNFYQQILDLFKASLDEKTRQRNRAIIGLFPTFYQAIYRQATQGRSGKANFFNEQDIILKMKDAAKDYVNTPAFKAMTEDQKKADPRMIFLGLSIEERDTVFKTMMKFVSPVTGTWEDKLWNEELESEISFTAENVLELANIKTTEGAAEVGKEGGPRVTIYKADPSLTKTQSTPTINDKGYNLTDLKVEGGRIIKALTPSELKEYQEEIDKGTYEVVQVRNSNKGNLVGVRFYTIPKEAGLPFEFKDIEMTEGEFDRMERKHDPTKHEPYIVLEKDLGTVENYGKGAIINGWDFVNNMESLVDAASALIPEYVYDSIQADFRTLQAIEQALVELADGKISKTTLEKLPPSVGRWARRSSNGYEVSTKGDRRFSALNAKLKDGRTIEEAYQLDIKGYREKGNDWRLGKGKPPLTQMTMKEQYAQYKTLWETFFKENPALLEDLRKKAGDGVLTDQFANTEINQARAISEILWPESAGHTKESLTAQKTIIKKAGAPLSQNMILVKAALAQKQFKESSIRNPGFFDWYAKQYPQLGWSQADFMRLYLESGANRHIYESRVAREVERVNQRKSDAIDAIHAAADKLEQKVPEKGEVEELIKQGLAEKIPTGFRVSREGMRLLRRSYILERLPQRLRKDYVAIADQGKSLNSLETAKDRTIVEAFLGLEAMIENGNAAKTADFLNDRKINPRTEDVMSEKIGLDEFEESLHVDVVGELKNPAAKTFYDQIASAFGVEIVIVRDKNYKSRYIPNGKNGKPTAVINVQNHSSFHHIIGHELFHHIWNSASPAQIKTFKDSIRAVSEMDFDEALRMAREKDPINGEEEFYAEIFAEVFRREDFYTELAQTFEGQSIAAKIISRLVNFVRKVQGFFTKPGHLLYEGKILFRTAEMNSVFELFADLIGGPMYQSKTAEGRTERYEGILNENGTLNHDEVRFFTAVGVASAREVKGYLNTPGKWLKKKVWQKIFRPGTRGYKDLLTNIENTLGDILDWIAKVKGNFWWVHWRAKPEAVNLAQMPVHGATKAEQESYFRVVKKWERLFADPVWTNAAMEKLHDDFVRGVKENIVVDQEVENEMVDMTRRDPWLSRDFENVAVADQAAHGSNMTEGNRRKWEKFIDLSKRREKKIIVSTGGINVGTKTNPNRAGILKARSLGYSDAVIEVFQEYKAVADEIHAKLEKIFPGFKKRETHYGQSLVWTRQNGARFHDSFDSILEDEFSPFEGSKRYMKGKNTQNTTRGIAEENELKYRNINPHIVFLDYVREANKLIMLHEMMNKGQQQGLIRIFRNELERDRAGFEGIEDPAFYLDRMNLGEGFKVKINEETYAHQDGQELLFSTREEAQEFIDKRINPRENANIYSASIEAVKPEKRATPFKYVLKIDNGRGRFLEVNSMDSEKAIREWIEGRDGYDADMEGVTWKIEPAYSEGSKQRVAVYGFHPDLAKLLNNALAKDWLREGSLMGVSGEQMMNLKNNFTAIEFAVSMFHFATITQEALASQTSWAARRYGVTKTFKGLASTHSDVQDIFMVMTKIIEQPELAENPAIREHVEKLFGTTNVDVIDVVNQYFMAGGMTHMDPSLRPTSYRQGQMRYYKETPTLEVANDRLRFNNVNRGIKVLTNVSLGEMMGSVKEVYDREIANEPNKYIRATFQSMKFGVLQGATAWLMETGIPKVKMAMWAREYTLQLDLQAELIQSGQKTKEEIARDAMLFIEDKFGEVNWKNNWMKPSLATSLKFLFRSFTWFTGSWKALSKAGIDLGKWGWFNILKGQIGGEQHYRLTDKGTWGITAIITHLMSVQLIALAYHIVLASGDDDEVPDDPDTPMLTKLLFPRYDPYDPSARLTVPSYVTEGYKIMRHLGVIGDEPEITKTISGRFNVLLRNSYETFWTGTDWRGTQVRNPNDNLAQQALDSFLHMVSVAPISVSAGMGIMRQKGFMPEVTLLGFAGLTDAPAAAKRSDAVNYGFHLSRGAHTTESTEEEADQKAEIQRALSQASRGNRKPLDKMRQEGIISKRQYDRLIKKVPRFGDKANPAYVPEINRVISILTIPDTLKVIDRMSEREQRLTKRAIEVKFRNMVKRKYHGQKYIDEHRAELLKRGYNV